MRYMVSPYHDPAVNLALEEYWFNQFSRSDEDIFLLWRNQPCIVLGKSQNAFREVRWLSAQRSGLPVLRRISGGGSVYHDLHNLNFSFLTRRSEQTVLNFAAFLEPIVDFLNRLGVAAYLAEPSDLKVGQAKISGNAQAVGKVCVLHHGTLLFDSDLSALQHWLTPHRKNIQSKAIQSNPSPVVNLASALRAAGAELSLEQFQDKLIAAVCADAEPLFLPEGAESAIRLEAERKYADFNWNYGRSPHFVYSRELTAESPGVQFEVSKGRIDTIRISCPAGGSVPASDPGRIEAALTGQPLSYPELAAALRTAGIGPADEWLDELFGSID